MADDGDARPEYERHDPPGLISLPSPDWEYKPRAVLTLIKDHASSASIAARHVFCYGGNYPMTEYERVRARHDPVPVEDPDAPLFREITCHMHASLRWCDTNRDKFEPYVKDGDEVTARVARNEFRRDLDYVIKDLPFPHFKPIAIKLLRTKWQSLNNERAVNSWCKTWASKRLTRAEANEVDASPFRGGIPCDNNALESSNNVDKGLLSRETATATEFIADLASKLVGPISASDTEYGGKLKERCNKNGSKFSKAPNNGFFFDQVRNLYKEFLVDEENDGIEAGHERPHTLRACIKLKANRELDIPAGSYWFVSDHGIADFKTHMEGTDYNSEDSVEFWEFLDEQNWSTLIPSLIYSPDATAEQEEMDFDEFAEWLRCFHVLRPIRISKNDEDYPGNRSLVHWLHMMAISGITCASKHDIINKPGMRMYSCSCSMYLHYMVCKHTLLFYLQSGVVTTLPKGKKSLVDRKRGRKRKAKGGEALSQVDP